MLVFPKWGANAYFPNHMKDRPASYNPAQSSTHEKKQLVGVHRGLVRKDVVIHLPCEHHASPQNDYDTKNDSMWH